MPKTRQVPTHHTSNINLHDLQQSKLVLANVNVNIKFVWCNIMKCDLLSIMIYYPKYTNEELYRKIQLAETLLQKVIQRKLRLFGHICRMNDNRKIKTLVFGMMDGSNKRGRTHREWSDDIEQWCGATLQELSHAALDRQRWAAIVTMASDTNGH